MFGAHGSDGAAGEAVLVFPRLSGVQLSDAGSFCLKVYEAHP